MKTAKIKSLFWLGCVVLAAAGWGDSAITLTGSYNADVERTFTTDTTVNLNGVTFTDCTLKFISANETRPVTVTLNLMEGTTNVFNMDNENKELIKATKKTNLVITGPGAMTLTSTKRITDGTDTDTGLKIPSALLVCNNLTVNGGDSKIVYDTDKPDTYCVLVKGNYLQTNGKIKVDASKKNKEIEFVGLRLDSKNTTFDLRGGKFNAEIAGTNGRAIDLRGSCTATFTNCEVKCEFEGPGARFINDGTIVFNGGTYEFTTNITAKMTTAFYPVDVAAVRTDKSITINGGDFEADLPLSGSEVFKTVDPEDLTATRPPITIKGGDLDLVAGDDCISAFGDVIISGGHIRATSVGDDAIDANGSLTISGGDIRAYATATQAHGLDVNNGKVDGQKKTLTISGGVVIATDGPGAVKIGVSSTEVGNANFQQSTYYGSVGISNYAGKYLSLSGTVNGAPVVVKPRLPTGFPTSGASTFNLLVSLPGISTTTAPSALSATAAYSDYSSHNPLAFERKSEVSGNTITTKFGETITIPDYYTLIPDTGKTKQVELSLNALATPTIISAAVEGANFAAGVQTLSRLRYRLVAAGSPSAADDEWTMVGSETVGDGQTKKLTAPKTGNARFYKVRVAD